MCKKCLEGKSLNPLARIMEEVDVIKEAIVKVNKDSNSLAAILDVNKTERVEMSNILNNSQDLLNEGLKVLKLITKDKI
tara:strand:- start:699 stop:935 length:237 start_codon:yes stop_codon:yes gene_type:complete